MLLSNILKEYDPSKHYTIFNEKDFTYLGLIASDIDESLCIFLDDEKYIKDIKKNVRMIITNDRVRPLLSCDHYGVYVVDNPREEFFKLHNFLHELKNNIQNKTTVGDNCNISKIVSIAEHNVDIGSNVTIEEFVVIRENTVIGDDTIIRAGAIIGGHGFEFKRIDGGILSVAHSGGVVVGKRVEIQYNSCIDRGVYSWDNTLIEDDCKIDNLVHIAHGVKVRKNTMIVANAGIGGRTIIGENTWIGFGATISNGLFIGNQARANIGAVVTKSIPDHGSYSGNFAIEHSIFLKNLKKRLIE